MLLTETKIDDSFTNAQFKMSGFHVPFRKDRNKHGGGLLMYVNDEIVCTQQVVPSLPSDIEALFVEINLRKQKWLIAGIYRSPSQDISYFVGVINETLLYLNYENIILIGDFNALESHEKMQTFNTELNLKNLIHQPTCYKSVTNPSCIDHIWVTDIKRFHNTCIIESGFSDYHKMTISFLNADIPKKSPRIIQYRSYRNFRNCDFKTDLEEIIRNETGTNFNEFEQKLKNIIDKHAPVKKKVARNNNAPFLTKHVRKEIMLRSRCKNVYTKNPTSENWNNLRCQRNKCVRLIREAKRSYFSALNLNNICDNKKFWKTVKPIFSDKSIEDNVKTLVEIDKVIKDKEKIANIMNEHFINITKSLKIDNIPHEASEEIITINDIIKCYRNHQA